MFEKELHLQFGQITCSEYVAWYIDTKPICPKLLYLNKIIDKWSQRSSSNIKEKDISQHKMLKTAQIFQIIKIAQIIFTISAGFLTCLYLYFPFLSVPMWLIYNRPKIKDKYKKTKLRLSFDANNVWTLQQFLAVNVVTKVGPNDYHQILTNY